MIAIKTATRVTFNKIDWNMSHSVEEGINDMKLCGIDYFLWTVCSGSESI